MPDHERLIDRKVRLPDGEFVTIIDGKVWTQAFTVRPSDRAENNPPLDTSGTARETPSHHPSQ